MNVLILINGAPKYKYFFYKLAQRFVKDNHQVYFAIDSHSSDYLEPLSAVDNGVNTFYFSDYFEENYNKKLDEQYECSYGDFYFSDFDRFLTHGYNLSKDKYYWRQAKLCLDSYFKEIIEKNNIDFVLYENISNSFAYSAWRISKLLNKKYIGLMGARLPGRFEIQTSIIDDELIKIDRLVQEPINEEDFKWFHEYRNNIAEIQPDYMKTNGLSNIGLAKLFKIKRLQTLYRIILISMKVNNFYEFQRGSIYKKLTYETIQTIKRFFTTKISRRYYTNNDQILEMSINEKYYVYPIHYHPESSTSVLAPDYTNEYSNIINIANKLPVNTFLYVKDHESAKGVQTPFFYKKISALPNVRLVDSTFNIKSLIKKSQGVITINSTAAYEAVLLSKPVFMFGRAFFENFPYITKLDSFEDLRLKLLADMKTYSVNEIAPWYVAYKKYTYGKTLLINKLDEADEQYFDELRELILDNVR